MTYADALETFEWSAETFWPKVDAAGAPHALARKAVLNVDRTHDRGLARSPADSEDIHRDLCAARAEALRRLYEAFGEESFNRFLYTVVAPKVTVFSDDPMNDEQLRTLAGGCQ